MRSRLEWFLGSALILLAAQLGFAAWHDHSAGAVAISPPWSPPGGRTFLCLEVAAWMETAIVPRAPKRYERCFVGAFVEEAYPSTCPSDR